MDIGNLITSFVLSLASYFIISHFIYRLSGRKDWAFFFLGIIFLSSLYDFLPYAFGNYAFAIILLVFVSRVLPVMLAASLFTRFTGGISKKKIHIKRSHFKEPNEDIYTTLYIIKIIYIMFVIAIFISVLSYFFMDGALQYVLYAVSLFVVAYGVFKLYQLRFFKNDKVVIIIGKEKENIYMKTIDPKLTKITIKDIYQNENYLIDKFATIQLYEENHFLEKHYLYWIATSKPFEIEDPTFVKTTLGYEQHIMGLMKYHDAVIKLNLVKNRYEVLKSIKYKK